jgi:hypothetical protein
MTIGIIMDEQDDKVLGVAATVLGAAAGGAVAAILSPIISPAGGGACGAAVNLGVREGIKVCGSYALDLVGSSHDAATCRYCKSDDTSDDYAYRAKLVERLL